VTAVACRSNRALQSNSSSVSITTDSTGAVSRGTRISMRSSSNTAAPYQGPTRGRESPSRGVRRRGGPRRRQRLISGRYADSPVNADYPPSTPALLFTSFGGVAELSYPPKKQNTRRGDKHASRAE